MSYWKTKVLPKIHKIFGKDATKKAAAVDACKILDDSKEEVSKELEEKKTVLQPKVQEIYEASETEIKELVKDPKEASLKKHSVKVQKFLDELVKIDFPGSKAVCEASSKFGLELVSGPVIFVFQKVSTFIVVTEEKPREIEVPAVQDNTTAAKETSKAAEESGAAKEKPAVVVETVTAPPTVEPSKEEASKSQPPVEEPPKKDVLPTVA